jgi:hypothetical protein
MAGSSCMLHDMVEVLTVGVGDKNLAESIA